MLKLVQSGLAPVWKIMDRISSIAKIIAIASLLALPAIGLDATSSPAHADPDLDVQNNSTVINNGDLIGDVSVANGTDFGSVIITKGATNTFLVVNRGTSDLTFQNPAVIVDDPTNFSAGSTSFNGQTMAPGDARSFYLTFHPQVASALSTTVTLRSNDPDEDPYTFVISGTGLDVPEINISSSETNAITDGGTDTHLFAYAGNQKTVTYTIQNTGSQALNLTNSAPTLTNATNVGTPVVSNYSVTTLPDASTTATFTVTYTPVVAGAISYDLDILSNDPDEATFDIAVSGTASGTPEINVQGNGRDISIGDTTPSTADNTDFGNVIVGTPSQQTFTIQNTGTEVLNISDISAHGDDFSISNAPTTVAINSSETFNVDITASGIGIRPASVIIRSDDIDEGSYSFEVTANGIKPEIALSSSKNISILDGGTESYGTEGIGVANTVIYSISNTGSAPLTLTGSAPTLSNPSNVGTPIIGNYSTTTVAANGGQSTFTVTYTPDAAGSFSFDLLIVSDDFDESNFDFTASGTAADLTAPFLLSVERQSPTTEITSADSLTWRLNLAKP
ncbi:MAG: choice-of-anchor D domain-containing protein [Rhizobiaceae bacterium]|nr:choice-of-anchor D domain-containing protein [Rhizobiaceae bacterium]